jgi:hypothetical protein
VISGDTTLAAGTWIAIQKTGKKKCLPKKSGIQFMRLPIA